MGPKRDHKGKAKKKGAPPGRSKAGKLAVTTDIPGYVWSPEFQPPDLLIITPGRVQAHEVRLARRAVLEHYYIEETRIPNSDWTREFVASLRQMQWIGLFEQSFVRHDGLSREFIANMDVHTVDPPCISTYLRGKKIMKITPQLLAEWMGIPYAASHMILGRGSAAMTESIKNLIIRPNCKNTGLEKTKYLLPKAKYFMQCCRKTVGPKAGAMEQLPRYLLELVYAVWLKRRANLAWFILEEWIRTYHGEQKGIGFAHLIFKIAQRFDVPLPTTNLEPPKLFRMRAPDEVKPEKGKRIQEVSSPSGSDFDDEEAVSDSDGSEQEDAFVRDIMRAQQASLETLGGAGGSGAAPAPEGTTAEGGDPGADEGLAEEEDRPIDVEDIYRLPQYRQDMANLGRWAKRNNRLLLRIRRDQEVMQQEQQSMRYDVRALESMMQSAFSQLIPGWGPPPHPDMMHPVGAAAGWPAWDEPPAQPPVQGQGGWDTDAPASQPSAAPYDPMQSDSPRDDQDPTY